MSRIRALAASLPHAAPLEVMRAAIVAGCALTLVLAGQSLPL